MIGGENYGQGSSREHAALAPRYLGVIAKIAKSFARIHKANLINFGIVPLVFKDRKDYDFFRQGDRVVLAGVKQAIASGAAEIVAQVGGRNIATILDVSERQRKVLLSGGILNVAGT